MRELRPRRLQRRCVVGPVEEVEKGAAIRLVEKVKLVDVQLNASQGREP